MACIDFLAQFTEHVFVDTAIRKLIFLSGFLDERHNETLLTIVAECFGFILKRRHAKIGNFGHFAMSKNCTVLYITEPYSEKITPHFCP